MELVFSEYKNIFLAWWVSRCEQTVWKWDLTVALRAGEREQLAHRKHPSG